MPQIRFIATGPDYYCPDCGRWLARVKDDGLLDLAAEAGITQVTEMPFPMDDPPEEIEALVTSAICLRCHPEEKMEEDDVFEDFGIEITMKPRRGFRARLRRLLRGTP